MPWFKVDDQLHGHPKARRAGLEAMGLWTISGSHSMSYLTDGFVETWFVESWPNGGALASKLVEVGLWIPVQGGWQFHDWDSFQPTRAQLEADRAAAAERKRKQRERDRDSDGRFASQGSHGVTDGVTHGDGHTPGHTAPYPVPSPHPYPNLSTSNQSGLSTETREILDRIDTKRIRAQLKVMDLTFTDEELADWAESVLTVSADPVRDPTKYLMTAIRTDSQDEEPSIPAWLEDHRRHRRSHLQPVDNSEAVNQ